MSGAGLGPKWTFFLFGIESKKTPEARLQPVKIAYAFFKDQGLPPDSFYQYSKRYELQAVRDPRCDESANGFAYIGNEDETGKQLAPTFALRFLDGAPKDALKPDAVLPCYILRPGKYKILSQDKDRKQSGLLLKDNPPPTPTTQ